MLDARCWIKKKSPLFIQYPETSPVDALFGSCKTPASLILFCTMEKTLASIDIGTHTARLLVAKELAGGGIIQPLARKRAYIRLADGLNYSKKGIIQFGAMDRALEVLQDFARFLSGFNVHSVHAVATGVVREASNGRDLLDRIQEETGIKVRPLTGLEEAVLTAKGALHALKRPAGPFLVFDLGGGSTEFMLCAADTTVIRSVPLGAMSLTRNFLKSDPPKATQVDALSGYIDQCLDEAKLCISGIRDPYFLVGTGGTVTTLAVMLHGISPSEISAERINGLVLERKEIEANFADMKRLSLADRMRLPGLDGGRADVILAGCLVVIRILYFFESLRVTVSFSDLLEGILLECIEGEAND
jgi:exopolyphosphatase/guanosine-5'-triphosphate,3'-diphosphate pyrophosphatase